jgi:hypothetical protein
MLNLIYTMYYNGLIVSLTSFQLSTLYMSWTIQFYMLKPFIMTEQFFNILILTNLFFLNLKKPLLMLMVLFGLRNGGNSP